MIQFLDAATGTATTAEMLISFLPLILILVFMVILIYLPQKRQDKKDAAMRSSIETVSYTHLDVYKRQVEQMTQGRPFSAPYCAAATAPAGEEKSMITPLQGSSAKPA